MDPQLIDRIYESAFSPDLWPNVLGELAEIGGARAGFLFLAKGEISHFTASSRAGVEAIAPLVDSGWLARCERFLRFSRVAHPGFVHDSSLYAIEETMTDPFYRDVLYPRGLGKAAGTVVRLPSDDLLAITVERDMARGPVEDSRMVVLDALRPHLVRTALMSSRLRLQQARTVSETLAAIGLAGLVLDETGKVLAANDRIQALTGFIRWRAHGRLGLIDSGADKLLKAAMATIHLDTVPAVRSFPIRDADGQAMVAHLLPVRLSARDIFALSAGVLVLTPVTLPDAAPVELVQSLFDLTPAEARVARGLAAGRTVEEIAVLGGVSANTVRTQVRGALEKTGCGRQVDMVALLTAISSTRLSDTV